MTDATAAPANSTRERIVAAAMTEFSRYGIAGARVDRIAKEARTSKERVYAHFRGKEALYAFVTGREPAAVADATHTRSPMRVDALADGVHDPGRVASWCRRD